MEYLRDDAILPIFFVRLVLPAIFVAPVGLVLPSADSLLTAYRLNVWLAFRLRSALLLLSVLPTFVAWLFLPPIFATTIFSGC